jgi:glycosyltransferase involved in cell wall biosynthesis
MFLMHYFHEDVVGGAEVQSYLLARQLAQSGYDVVYLCDRLSGSTPREETRDGIRIWRWFRNVPLFKIVNLPLFLYALLRFRPDAIYHRYASQYTFMGSVARLFGVDYVWNCCEDKHLERHYFRGLVRQHFRSYRGNALKKSALFADAWLSDILFSIGARFSSAAVAQNLAQQKSIMERFGKPARIIRSGHPQPEHANGNHRDVEVLWLATLQKRKRPELFLDAAGQCIDLPAKFVLAGRTSNAAYRQMLVERAESLPNVEMRHVDSYERSWKEFERGYLYVCTSESEGFPNAFIQAWICGLPVVSLGIDPDNFISQHGLGFVCANVEEMTGKIRFLLCNPDVREEMSRRVRQVAKEHFDIERVAKDFEGVLFGDAIDIR